MHSSPSHYQQLQPEERVTIASLTQQNHSVRAIARQLRRSPATISRELKRNACSSGYGSARAQGLSRQRRCSGRPAIKLHPESILFALVIHLLRLRWSPEQIALTLARLYPPGHEYRVSYETIYNCIYAMPVGELRKELIATLRHAHNKRLPRSKGKDRRGQIPDMLSIHVRPPEIEDRQFPGHWEGDLIKGEGNASAVGTLVERTSRLVMLVKLPEFRPASAANVLQAFTDKLLGIAQPMRLSMTYDQGREMDLTTILVTHPQATFIVRLRGDSMREAGIFDGDLLVVNRALKPIHTDVVLAVVDGEFTCKTLWLKHGRMKLKPANPTYPEIVPKDGQIVEIWGVVTATIKRFRV